MFSSALQSVTSLRRTNGHEFSRFQGFYWSDNDWVEIENTGGNIRPRRSVTLCEAGIGVTYGVHDSSVETAYRAVLERVFLVKDTAQGFVRCPKPLSGAYERLREVRSKLVKVVPSTARWTYQQFVDSYTGRRNTLYAKARDSLLMTGVRRSHAYLSSFVKAEKLNLTAKPDPTPRIIQPRHPVFNTAIGVFIKPLEGAIYKGITNLFGEPTVFKGMNATQQGALMKQKWSRFTKPVAVGIDASRFDQHVSREALEWEHSVYLALMPDPEFRKLLSWQLVNRGFVRCGDGTVRYEVNGSRMSGDMNTALGNCLIMCALVWEYMRTLGLTVDDFALANNGDDCVVIFEQHHLYAFQRGLDVFFLDFGFEMTVEPPCYELEQIEFCQLHPVHTPYGYVMVRDPRTCIDKDLTTFKWLECTTKPGWDLLRKAISDGGTALAGCIPVLGSFYAMIGRGVERKVNKKGDPLVCTEVTGFDMLAKGMKMIREEPISETRLSFWRAFGMSPDEQIALEEAYDNVIPQWGTPVLGFPCKITC